MSGSPLRDSCFATLAVAYARGLARAGELELPGGGPLDRPLQSLDSAEVEAILAAAHGGGVDLERFRRTVDLPRVRRVLGTLAGLAPTDLLDIGSGRGAFLWPLLDRFPDLPVTAIDVLPERVRTIGQVAAGGIDRLSARTMDAAALAYPERSFDVVTVLEVLDHIPEAARALAEAVRCARRTVVISVPSRFDDRSGEADLFSPRRLIAMLRECGVYRVEIDHVPRHMIAVATVD